MSDILLEVKGLKIRYGAIEAVKGIDLTINSCLLYTSDAADE